MDKLLKFANAYAIAALALAALPGETLAEHFEPGETERGAEVYNDTCVACHGENGKGEIEGVPNFNKKSGPLAQGDDLLVEHMVNGFQSPGAFMEMPAMGGNPDLTEEDMVDVLAYLRATYGKK